MTPERWQKVKKVFQAALDQAPPERLSFVSNACGDDEELRREVQSLISSHEQTGTFIDSPAYEAAAELLLNDNGQMNPGQLLGAFEIRAFISRGGMGEVYLAQDRRLNRRVALKVLPASFTRDLDRLRRFEQEARAASALNHPNIITIYEILKANSTHVIAAEFVDGETLRQRLSLSSLPLQETLHIAIQIADALAAAHAAGIVHRDIKPENIMLRPDGYVKVLDFGLAKLTEEPSAAVAAEAPTKQVKTGSGMVLGTAGYMSPEQARGKTVDARSDIFSLGAVIYEMVTQRKPFDGETPSDVLAAILKTEPAPVSEFAPDTPAELTRIVTKALRKDREERYQVVRDLLLDLKTLKEEMNFQARLVQASPSLGNVSEEPVPAGAVPLTQEVRHASTFFSQALSVEFQRHRSALLVTFAVISMILLGGGFFLYRLLTRTATNHFQATSVARITNSGKVIDARLSADGNYLVYCLSDAGKQGIWIRQISAANDRLIVPPAAIGLFGITITHDNRELYYVIKQNYDAGTLYRIPILGGTPTKVLEKIDGPVTFSPDGKHLAFVRANYPSEDESALMLANADGTDEQKLAIRKKPDRFAPIFFTGPSWSPDGKLIAVSVLTFGNSSRVFAFPVDGGKDVDLSPDPWPFSGQVQWLPDMSGLLVIAGQNAGTSAQVWLLSYPTGEKRQITNDLDQHRAIGLTADGKKFVNVVASGVISLWLTGESDGNHAIQLPTGNMGFFASSGNTVGWTRDARIVFGSTEGNNIDLWIMDGNGENRKFLTSNSGRNVSPVVSPDNRYVVFSSTRGGKQNIWRINLDGSNPKQLTNGVAESLPAITPDGKWVIYTALGTTRPTIWRVSIDGGQPVEVTHRVSTNPMVSPDGTMIAYLFPDSPDPLTQPNRIGIIPFEGGEPIKTFEFQPATTVFTIAQWAADGKSILYTSNINNVTNIWSQSIDGGPPKQVTDFKDSFMTGFNLSPDGKQLVCSRGIFTRDAVVVEELH